MRRLNGLYTQRFNKRHKRIGHLFQGRYKAFVIEKESYLLEVCRYIVLNPLQAGLVKHIGEWQWSSYRSTAGLEPESEIVEAVIKWNYKQKEVADYLGLHYSTISKIVKNYSRFKN